VLPDDLRVRRTSHTGGHRFAPTAILLPEGTMWAYLDEDAVSRIVDRTGSVDDVVARYRGWCGLASAGQQALDRILLGERGWGWLDTRRRGHDLGDGRVSVSAVLADGTTATWMAEVRRRRAVRLPACGTSGWTGKIEDELALVDVRRLPGPTM
jgi:hypothetical protein